MKRFAIRRLLTLLYTSSLLGISSHAFASGFQLFEQDGASIANYHAGYAALATDASIAFYNPAGITRFCNQQLVIGGAAVMTDFKYTGTVQVSTLPEPDDLFSVVAQGGGFSFVPNLHYVAPITDRIGFGFSVVVPFGLKTDFGRTTAAKYAATRSAVTVVDVSPSLGFQLTKQASFGIGFDIQRMEAQFDQVAVLSDESMATDATNNASGTGYGYHLGALYQFDKNSRVGLSYHSQVAHHLTGRSKFYGPLDVLNNDMPIISDDAKTNVKLPAYTALSGYHHFCDSRWAIMGTAVYTQWNVIQSITLQNVAGVVGTIPSTTIEVTIPEKYRNTWTFSIGTDYYLNDQVILRGGIGYDETPVRDKYRHLSLPDNNRYVFALGGHYQASKTLGFDLGWTHLFISETRVNPPPLQAAAQVVTTDGHVNGSADVIGAQITWDIV